MKQRSFHFQAVFFGILGRLSRMVSIQSGPNISGVEFTIYTLCFSAFVIIDKEHLVTKSEGMPSIAAICLILIIWFLVPFQLHFGWKQLLGRMVMASSGTFAIFDKIYGPFFQIPYLSHGIVQAVILVCAFLYTVETATKMNMREQSKKKKEFIQHHRLDVPFFFLDIYRHPFDVQSAESIASNIEKYGVQDATILWIPVRLSKDKVGFKIAHTGQKYEFLILGITFTGFEFLICHFAASL